MIGSAGAVGVAALAGCTGRSFDSYTGADAWRTVHHDTHNTNRVPATPPRNAPRVVWRVTDAFDPEPVIKPTPAVADGRVYLGGQTVTAYDAADGEQLWETAARGVANGLAVSDSRLYATGWDGDDPRDGVVAAHDPTTGERLWSADCDSYPSPPTPIENGVVVGDSGGQVKFRDGRRVWRLFASAVFPAPPAGITRRSIYDPSSSLFARHDRRSSPLEWVLGPDEKWVAPDRIASDRRFHAPAVTAERVLVPVSNRAPPDSVTSDRPPALIAYDETGSVQWRLPVGTDVSTPAVSGSTGFVVTARTEWTEGRARQPNGGDATLRAFDVASGESEWAVAYPGFGIDTIAPIVADGRVYAVFRDHPERAGLLVAHETDGTELWSASLSAWPHHLAAVGDRLYVTLSDGTFLAFGPR